MSRMTDNDFLRLTRERCRNALRNTATGKYLAAALRRLEELRQALSDAERSARLEGSAGGRQSSEDCLYWLNRGVPSDELLPD